MKNGIMKIIYPGIDRIKTELVYRTPGFSPSERMGVGFISKTRRVDFESYHSPNFVLVIVIRGNGQYADEYGNLHEINSDSCFKRFPGILHSNYINPESGWLEYFIEMGHALYQAAREMKVIRDNSPVVEPISLDEHFISRLWTLKERLRTVDETELPIVAGEIFSMLSECRNRIDCMNGPLTEKSLMDKACEFLSSNFDQTCDIKVFCRRHGIGYENFRKMFKRQNGVSPWKYRILRRLDAAYAMLRNPDLHISEIASSLGYSSQFEFSAQFKKHLGISPSRFR